MFENGKTQLFNSGGVVKWAYFQKKKKKKKYPFKKQKHLTLVVSLNLT